MVCAPSHPLARPRVRGAAGGADPVRLHQPRAGLGHARGRSTTTCRRRASRRTRCNIVMELAAPRRSRAWSRPGSGSRSCRAPPSRRRCGSGSSSRSRCEPPLIRHLSVVYPKERFHSRLVATASSLREGKAGRRRHAATGTELIAQRTRCGDRACGATARSGPPASLRLRSPAAIGVIRAQDVEHFRAAEFRRHRAAFGQPLAKLGARNEQPVLIVVRAGAPRRHAAARGSTRTSSRSSSARSASASVRDLVEDAMRVERAVVAADAGVVAARRSGTSSRSSAGTPRAAAPRAARRSACRADSRPAPRCRRRKYLSISTAIACVRTSAGNVAGLQVAEQRMHEHAVADLDRDLGQIFVRAVHRVAGLERGDARPAEPLEFARASRPAS